MMQVPGSGSGPCPGKGIKRMVTWVSSLMAETEAAIKEETKITIRLIPLPGQGPEPEPGTCIKTGNPSPRRVLFAKAY